MSSTFPEWLERKYDGIRALAFKQGRDVRLLSRNRLPQYNQAVCDAIAPLGVTDAILDGELAWRGDSKVSYHVFDLLWLRALLCKCHSSSGRCTASCDILDSSA
jgi:ATP-dependent DNA ligase